MKKIFVLICLVFCLFFANYEYLDNTIVNAFSNYEEGVVERIVDGDTVVVNGSKVRLLGINSPEKGEKYSNLAQEFLEEKILGKKVRIYFGKTKFDRYKRKLGYIFLKNQNVNLESVRKGFSNYYFPQGADQFSKEIKEAWQECLQENENLCKKSKDNCIKIKNIDTKLQELILENICSEEISLQNWEIKDEGRKKIILENETIGPNEEKIFTKELWNQDYVWTKSGDSCFLRDKNKLLVDFFTY